MTLGVLQPDGSVQRPSYSPDAMTFPEMYEKVHGKALEGDEIAQPMKSSQQIGGLLQKVWFYQLTHQQK